MPIAIEGLMGHKVLTKMPLVEAIFELHWSADSSRPTAKPYASPDLAYQLLAGRFFDRIKEGYPVFDAIPSPFPSGVIAPNIPQYRFRVAENGWPLVQLGPGVIAVNAVRGYSWRDFRPRIESAVRVLLECHPEPSQIKIEQLQLRYIDAAPFAAANSSVLDFLRDKMRISIQMPPGLFAEDILTARPAGFVWQNAFEALRPRGIVQLTFSLNDKDGKPHLFWEISHTSINKHIPNMPDNLPNWLEQSHALTVDHIFWMLIKGDLEKEFGVVHANDGN
jgi:uncharacterized protein (TIGR04255 family)